DLLWRLGDRDRDPVGAAAEAVVLHVYVLGGDGGVGPRLHRLEEAPPGVLQGRVEALEHRRQPVLVDQRLEASLRGDVRGDLRLRVTPRMAKEPNVVLDQRAELGVE